MELIVRMMFARMREEMIAGEVEEEPGGGMERTMVGGVADELLGRMHF